MFAIWMHFKGEYWIIEKYVSKDLVYAPNWVDTTYLHLHTYFHNPQKNGFELWIHDMSNRWSPKHELWKKIIMEKPVNLP